MTLHGVHGVDWGPRREEYPGRLPEVADGQWLVREFGHRGASPGDEEEDPVRRIRGTHFSEERAAGDETRSGGDGVVPPNDPNPRPRSRVTSRDRYDPFGVPTEQGGGRVGHRGRGLPEAHHTDLPPASGHEPAAPDGQAAGATLDDAPERPAWVGRAHARPKDRPRVRSEAHFHPRG